MTRSPMTDALRRLAAEREQEFLDLGLAATGVETDVRRRRATGLAATAAAAVALVALTWGTLNAVLTDAAPDEADPAVSQPPGTTRVLLTDEDLLGGDPGGIAEACGGPPPAVDAEGSHLSLALSGDGAVRYTRKNEQSLVGIDSNYTYSLTLTGDRPSHVYSLIQWLVVDGSGRVVSSTRAEWVIVSDKYGGPLGESREYPLFEPGTPHPIEVWGPFSGSSCGTHPSDLDNGDYLAYPVLTAVSSEQAAARGQVPEQALYQYGSLAEAEQPHALYSPGSWDCRRFRAESTLDHPDCGGASMYDRETGRLATFVPDALVDVAWSETLVGEPLTLTLDGEWNRERAEIYRDEVDRGERDIPSGWEVADIPLTCGAPYAARDSEYVGWPWQIRASLDQRVIANAAPRLAEVLASPDNDGEFTFVGEWDAWFVSELSSAATGSGIVGHATVLVSPEATVELARYDGPVRTTLEFRDNSWCGGEVPADPPMDFAIIEGPGVHVSATTGEVTTGTFRWVVNY